MSLTATHSDDTTSALREQFRDAMAAVATPVSVVTAVAGGLPHGTTVSAFASLSMDPPMLLVSLDRQSQLLGVIRESLRFGLNVLGSDQSALALTFATKGGAAKFSGVGWELDHGLPRLEGTPWVCTTTPRCVRRGPGFGLPSLDPRPALPAVPPRAADRDG